MARFEKEEARHPTVLNKNDIGGPRVGGGAPDPHSEYSKGPRLVSEGLVRLPGDSESEKMIIESDAAAAFDE